MRTLLLCGLLLLLGCAPEGGDAHAEAKGPFVIGLSVEVEEEEEEAPPAVDSEPVALDPADILQALAALECAEPALAAVRLTRDGLLEWACTLTWIPVPVVEGFEVQRP